MTETTPYYIGEDMKETITGLSVGGAFINNATITYVIKDEYGVAVAGGSGNYDYTPASDGNYTAVIDAAVTSLMAPDKFYYLWATILATTNDGKRRLKRLAQYREST